MRYKKISDLLQVFEKNLMVGPLENIYKLSLCFNSSLPSSEDEVMSLTCLLEALGEDRLRDDLDALLFFLMTFLLWLEVVAVATDCVDVAGSASSCGVVVTVRFSRSTSCNTFNLTGSLTLRLFTPKNCVGTGELELVGV